MTRSSKRAPPTLSGAWTARQPAMAAVASRTRVTMEVGDDGVALITVCNPPVNALHPSIFDGLKEKYAEAMRRDDVKAIVLAGAEGKFCGSHSRPCSGWWFRACHSRIATPEAQFGLSELTLA